MTVAQTNTLLNSYIDITQQPTPVLTSNSGTTNVTNLNTILAAAPAGSTIYTPGNAAVYQFQGALTALTKDFTFVGQYGHSVWAWANAGVTTTPLISLNPSGFYTGFFGMTFQTFVTMTTNYVVDCKANVNTYFVGCQFIGGASTPFSGCINFSDATNGGNGAVVSGCYFSAWHDTAINVNGLQASPYFSNLAMIGNALASGNSAAGIACPNGGAILMNNCGIVKCQVNLNLSVGAGNVVASVFAVNCFFDQATLQSLLITGSTGTAVRCHFVGCWFTLIAGSGPTAAVAITTTGAAIHSGIEFQDCWVVNVSGTTGTTNGFLITGASDFTIANCQIAGWTNGINITPPTTAGVCAPFIENNTIGPAGGAAGNGTGILLNVGAPTTYGRVFISNNQMMGNTTAALLDASTVAAASNAKYIGNNMGVLMKGSQVTLAAIQNTASTTQTTILTCPVLANAVRVGDVFKFELHGISSSTGTLTFEVFVGTTNNAAGAVPAGTVAWTSTTTAAQVANARASFHGLLTVRSIGAGTVNCEAVGYAGAVVVPTLIAATTAPAVTTTANWFITLSVACSAGLFAVQDAYIGYA
jgi:hypothetical protein